MRKPDGVEFSSLMIHTSDCARLKPSLVIHSTTEAAASPHRSKLNEAGTEWPINKRHTLS